MVGTHSSSRRTRLDKPSKVTVQIFVMCFVAVLTGGCATGPSLTKDVKSFTSDDYVLLKSDSTYHAKGGGIARPEWDVGLRAGVYRPELSNELGTFFRGPESCVFQTGGNPGPFNGGIWIPRDRINYKPQVYWFFVYDKDTAMRAGGIVGSTILAASEGDIKFMATPPSGAFTENVVVTNLPLGK